MSVKNVLPGSAGRLSGIDFSSNNFGNLSIGQAAQAFQKDIAGQQFSFVKATQGTGYTNPYFASEWKILGEKVKSGQMALRSAYGFLDPGTYSDGVAQAKHFLSTVGIHGKMPQGTKLTLDWEMAAASTPQVLKGAADYIHKVTGEWPIVYTNQGNMAVAHATVPNAPKWSADYGPSYRGIGDQGGKIMPEGSDKFYQYSDGRGYGLPYDMNVFNGSLADLKKFANSPSQGPTPEQVDKKDNALIAKQLAKGNLKQGDNNAAVGAMRRMLTLAGYESGKPNNKFGGWLAAQLRQFQESQSLPSTGQLDPATFDKLKNVESEIRTMQKKGWKDSFVQGEKSAQIAKDQKMLDELGYQAGKGGVYDAATQAAERQFRKDDKTVHRKSNFLTPGLQGVIAKDVAALDHNPYFERVKPTSNNMQLDAETALAAAAPGGISPTSFGPTVKNVQARLLAAGFDPKGITGTWDTRTQTALQDFQKKAGLPVTGTVDTATWDKLAKSYLYANSSTSPAQSLNEEDAAVKASQKLLEKDGFKSVKASGLFDRSTQAAVKAFQKKEHLRQTGQVDGKTLKALKSYKPPSGASTDRSKIYLEQPNGWSCAPTSLAMAEAAWGVGKATDANMFRLAADMGDGPGVGLPGNASLLAAQARRDGLKASFNSSPDASAVRAALKAGHTCCVNGSLSAGGHFIYIAGLDKHGNYIVFDPDRPSIHTWNDADLNAFTHANPGQHPTGFAEIWK